MLFIKSTVFIWNKKLNTPVVLAGRDNRSYIGFTLIEILLVISILAILVTFTIMAINPARQLAKSRDAERSTDIYLILSSLNKYATNHDGAYPEVIATDDKEICRTDSMDCEGLCDLSVLTDGQEYLVSVPLDPLCGDGNQACSLNGTGYFLKKSEGGKLTVSAPNSEIKDNLSVTR
ncbi:type II secretion system protein [Candidatus Kaiserbacteria bacterium]|nr:type II secretion system protein [Candidatus Kaiserbacteria bacterium]USN92207.1 MAG: type II secretion system protein [Candidatus Nomurabacteria bacterium]